MSLAQPVSVPPLNHSSRLSATPSLSVSVNFQILGGPATYTEPLCQRQPCGNITLSANTTDLSKRPSPLVSSRHSKRADGSLSCSNGFAFEPDESVTNNRPRSSKLALTGRWRTLVPATSST